MSDAVGRKNGSGCLVLVSNRGFALASSRTGLIEHFLRRRWKVVAATADDAHAQRLRALGVVVEPVHFARSGLAPRRDWAAYRRLTSIYGHYKPDLIHHFHAKPMILGNHAARRSERTRIVNTVTGLGHAYIAGGFARRLANRGYRSALWRSQATIFQNPDDQDLFRRHQWVAADRSHLIVSSGVDTERFRPARAPGNGVRVLMVARLIWEKGIREFVRAAEICRNRYPEVRFCLAGEWDDVHPDAVPREWIAQQVARGTIDFLGYLNNIEAELPRASMMVLPSYREGTPRTLLEAAACGLPIVTTDAPGCRETVIDGETGCLVPPRDHESLAASMLRLLRAPQLRAAMGKAGRAYIESKFDIRYVTGRYLDVYRSVGIDI